MKYWVDKHFDITAFFPIFARLSRKYKDSVESVSIENISGLKYGENVGRIA